VRYLRRKLGVDKITTVRGLGYRLAQLPRELKVVARTGTWTPQDE